MNEPASSVSYFGDEGAKAQKAAPATATAEAAVTETGKENDEFYDCASDPGANDVDEEDLKQLSKKAVDDSDDESQPPPSKLYEKMVKRPCCGALLIRCPRCSAISIGVVIPLFILIALSIGFGAQLCDYEAPPEIETNDDRLANVYWANKSALAVANLTLLLPEICFVLYLESNNHTNLTEFNNTNITLLPVGGLVSNVNATRLIEVFLEEPDAAPVPYGDDEYYPIDDFEPEVIPLNVSEFYYFMEECGKSAQTVAEQLLFQTITNVVQATEQLTFNWIRCFKGANEGSRDYGHKLNAQERSAQGQSLIYTKTWIDDRESLYDQYYNELLEEGVPQKEAVIRAERRAVQDATGGSTCEMNAPAAAWFWFTVQTTVGYGNTPPTTDSSRAMVYVIGFVSIIAFGGVLAAAGYILSYLFDDYATRLGFKILTEPWIGAFIWGSAYYLWMVLIAYTTIRWKEKRLNLSFSWYEGYWFSYISTTTVGLGDLYLEPEGLIGVDLVYFPLTFLIGFMYFAAFIGKVIDIVNQVLKGERKSLMQTLLEKNVTWRQTFQKERPTG